MPGTVDHFKTCGAAGIHIYIYFFLQYSKFYEPHEEKAIHPLVTLEIQLLRHAHQSEVNQFNISKRDMHVNSFQTGLSQ